MDLTSHVYKGNVVIFHHSSVKVAFALKNTMLQGVPGWLSR